MWIPGVKAQRSSREELPSHYASGAAPAAVNHNPTSLYSSSSSTMSSSHRARPCSSYKSDTCSGSFFCPGPAQCLMRNRNIWGGATSPDDGATHSNCYTGDSPPCQAARHAGVIPSDGPGSFSLQPMPGRGEYYGMFRNGVTSRKWGSYAISYCVLPLGGGGVGSDEQQRAMEPPEPAKIAPIPIR